MKKKRIKNLALNKINVSRLNNQRLIIGGTGETVISCEGCETIRTRSEDRNCP